MTAGGGPVFFWLVCPAAASPGIPELPDYCACSARRVPPHNVTPPGPIDAMSNGGPDDMAPPMSYISWEGLCCRAWCSRRKVSHGEPVGPVCGHPDGGRTGFPHPDGGRGTACRTVECSTNGLRGSTGRNPWAGSAGRIGAGRAKRTISHRPGGPGGGGPKMAQRHHGSRGA